MTRSRLVLVTLTPATWAEQIGIWNGLISLVKQTEILTHVVANIRKKSAPIAQSGERWDAELTGSESPVRAASALAVCSLLGLLAVCGSGRAQGKLTSVERGGPCPAMWAR